MKRCTWCDGYTDAPPRADDTGHCRAPSQHAVPEPHQVWVWLGDHYEIRGTGVTA